MVNITIKTYRIRIVVESESTAVHLSNFLPKVRATCGISSVETDLEVKLNSQDRYIVTLLLKYSSTVREHLIAHYKKRSNIYWKLGLWKKLIADEHQQILYGCMTWNLGWKKTCENGKQSTSTKDEINWQIKHLQ